MKSKVGKATELKIDRTRDRKTLKHLGVLIKSISLALSLKQLLI